MPSHDFYLVPKVAVPKTSIVGFMDSIKELAIGHIEVDDALILYMSDTLNWVPTKNPPFINRPIEMGLDYYGMTKIDENSVDTLKNILNGWRVIFAIAPKNITLTGMYIEGDEEEESEYEKNIFDQVEILKQLDALIALVVEVEKHGHTIYHMGI
ncbi:hypothetical protein BACCIP111895_04686 [Neobacillus rhizosphaerae]|uniref:Uncharacterized protein n=1 Tax=Neobacillus rhizosphaerae TaxID=2880965 RepID=A0ABM9EXP8_9BACI|nr:hypothetical protein [Neobacillus rhizosphaerae]CAH2717472.1 hypothetical protein BACCIP111895_04686 [Neobacillus rhizosphaerae]